MSAKFLNGIGGLVGSAAAAYHQRLKEANDKAAAQARQNADTNYRNNYQSRFAWQLNEAIKATAPLTGLVEPLSPNGLITDKPVLTLKGGCKALVFSGWSKPGFGEIPVNQIMAQLNEELKRLCFLNGPPKIDVIKVLRSENHRVGFIMALADDVQAARQAAAAQQAAKTAQQAKNKNGPIQI